jgi:hypothetical protein
MPKGLAFKETLKGPTRRIRSGFNEDGVTGSQSLGSMNPTIDGLAISF